MSALPIVKKKRRNRKTVQEVSKQNFPRTAQDPFYYGAGRRIRTDDLLITNQLLYQLSYAGKKIARPARTDSGSERRKLAQPLASNNRLNACA